jgi:hypothetical protein
MPGRVFLASMRSTAYHERQLQRRRREAEPPADRRIPPSSPPAAILALQQSAGNSAVARMLARRSSALEEEAPVEENPLATRHHVIEPTGEAPPPPWEPAPTEAELGVPVEEEQVEEQEGPTLARWPWGSKRAAPKAPKPAKVEGVLTPQDDFSGRSHSSFGVGERVNLSFKSEPSVTAASLGGLQWEVTSGPATVVSATDGTGTLTCGDMSGKVTLSLKVAAGPNVGTVKATRTLSVVAPDDARMVRAPGTGLRHTHGKAGVGFKGEIFLRPKTVSFHWMEMREGAVAGVGTGYYAGQNGVPHAVGAWVTVGPGDSGRGSKVNGVDTVDSGDNDPPFSKGDFQWNIPWEYRANGGPGTEFTRALHHDTISAKGDATIEKKGAGPFSKKANDPTSTF